VTFTGFLVGAGCVPAALRLAGLHFRSQFSGRKRKRFASGKDKKPVMFTGFLLVRGASRRRCAWPGYISDVEYGLFW
jgi:hypothetical protein